MSFDEAAALCRRMEGEPVAETCQCTVSTHVVHFEDGHMMEVLDEGCKLPSLGVMCFGTCADCGLPYHTDFQNEEPRRSFD
jgi:hypothetical protein